MLFGITFSAPIESVLSMQNSISKVDIFYLLLFYFFKRLVFVGVHKKERASGMERGRWVDNFRERDVQTEKSRERITGRWRYKG